MYIYIYIIYIYIYTNVLYVNKCKRIQRIHRKLCIQPFEAYNNIEYINARIQDYADIIYVCIYICNNNNIFNKI